MKRIGEWLAMFCILALPGTAQQASRAPDDELTLLGAQINARAATLEIRQIAVLPFLGFDAENATGATFAAALVPYVENARWIPLADVPYVPGDPTGAKAIGQLTGADAVLIGSLLELPTTVEIHCRLIDTKTGQVIGAVTRRVSPEYINGLISRHATIRKKPINEVEAATAAHDVTDAILRGNVSAASTFLGAQSESDVLALREDILAARIKIFRFTDVKAAETASMPFQITILKTSVRGMTSVIGSAACRKRVFAIVALFRDDDHRLIQLGVTEAPKGETPSPRSALDLTIADADFRSFSIDLERASGSGADAIPRLGVSASELRQRLCETAPIVAFERVRELSLKTFAVFLDVQWFYGRVTVRVDVDPQGTARFWEILPHSSPETSQGDVTRKERENDRGATESSTTVPREVRVRSELQQNVSRARSEGREALASLKPYGVGTENFYLAEQTTEALSRVREVTLRAMPAPELEPLRRWVTNALDVAQPPITERTLVVKGKELLYRLVPVDALERYKKKWEDSLNKVETIEDMAPDITIASAPLEAKFRLYMKDDSTATYEGTTDDVVANVYRGLYELTVEKSGHKSWKSPVDLVNDPRTTLKCRLVAKQAKEDSICRQE